MDCSLPGSSIHGVSPGKNTGVSCHALLQGTSPTGMKPRSPALQVDSLLSEPPGKLKNTRVGSLSVLQGIFLIQKTNQGLLHCRQILYQLSYQGSPKMGRYLNCRQTACVSVVSHVQLFVTPWAIACQALLPMEFSRQEYWSGLPFPPPGDLLNPRIDPAFHGFPALAGRVFTTEPPEKPIVLRKTTKSMIKNHKIMKQLQKVDMT